MFIKLISKAAIPETRRMVAQGEMRRRTGDNSIVVMLSCPTGIEYYTCKNGVRALWECEGVENVYRTMEDYLSNSLVRTEFDGIVLDDSFIHIVGN